jgi:predicted DsbA family dithiol-disulfide isomerase
MKRIQTFESFLNESASSKIFYHGGKKLLKQSDLKPEIMYFTDDAQQAASYSTERHLSSANNVTKANLSMNKTLKDYDVLLQVAKGLGLDPDKYTTAEIIEQPKVVAELTKMEYDSAIFSDLGFMSDFEEFEAYIVFNAKKQVKIL